MKKSDVFDWDEWIPKIEAAAKKNNTIGIPLPKEEWERLKKDNLGSLKKKLSDNAYFRIILQKDGYFFTEEGCGEGPHLLVVHICGGRCQ